jgi:nicotinate-nucleotide pyrophosphorylase (carboxylating)
MNFDLELDAFLHLALREDIGTGDVTTIACVSADAASTGNFIAKESGIICGLDVAERVFALIDGKIKLTRFVSDGSAAQPGDVVAQVTGPSRSILSGERTALNLLQYMSGISTKTNSFRQIIYGTTAKIVDTRKVLPGMRSLSKYAVRIGGGLNHRFGLFDGVLIKDNHIRAAGGIKNAVTRARGKAPHTLKIEVECETRDQVLQALECGADIIMLDNMSVTDMRECTLLVGGRALVEASGNMGDRDLRAVAECGVDFISIGALTHSVRALDISLQFE